MNRIARTTLKAQRAVLVRRFATGSGPHEAAGDEVSKATLEGLGNCGTQALIDALWVKGWPSSYIEGARPLTPDAKLAGRAVTVRFVPHRPDIAADKPKAEESPEYIAFELCGPDEILVTDTVGPYESIGGDIKFLRLAQNKIGGLVTDGSVRDTDMLVEYGFPVFSYSTTAKQGPAYMWPWGYNEVISCGGVVVRPGDAIVGDKDGVVVVPKTMAEEVLKIAHDREEVEEVIRQELIENPCSPGRYYPFKPPIAPTSPLAKLLERKGHTGMLKRITAKGFSSFAGGRRSYSTSSAQGIVCREFGGPEVMKMEEKAIPAPGPGQAVVRIEAAGVNPSDTYVRLGPNGPYAGNAKLIPELPYTPGKDGAGVVEAVGDGCDFAVGDRVYTTNSVTGTYAEMALCNSATMWNLPASITAAEGACVGVPAATAYRAVVQRAGAQSGDAIFIHGASGAVGLAAVQLAVARGCFVVGTASTAEGQAAVAAAGAQVVLNHREEGYLQAAKAARDGGFDVVLEMAADANLVNDLGLLGKSGRVAIVGSKAAPIAVNPRLTMPNELDVRGVFLSNASAGELEEIHAALFQAMEKGELKPVVGTEMALAEAGRAHTEVMQAGKAGNIVLMT